MDTNIIQGVKWQRCLQSAHKCVRTLCATLQLDMATCPYDLDIDASFSCLVTQDFVAQMGTGDWGDPLLLQVLPRHIEQRIPGSLDPVGEHMLAHDGLIHKYQGRALWVLSSGCAINCRYCFRRHFDYQTHVLGRRNWERVLNQLRSDQSISEIILSGGDPLLLSDEILQQLFAKINRLSHIKTIRIHSRLPIVLPSRVTDTLLHLMEQSPQKVVVVVHVNHVQELSSNVGAALQKIAASAHALFNQSVLLAGVNDHADILCDLCEHLFSVGCMPYYVHMLDEIAGAMHFKVEEDCARHIMRLMQERLPGYLMPRFVRDMPGSVFKQSI